MYTVVRFESGTANDDKLFALGKSLNRIRPGVFAELDKGNFSFSCSVAVGGQWRDHADAILQLAKEGRRLIKRARSLGITVSFDTAIEPNDMRNVNMLSLVIDQTMIRTLNSIDSYLEFTCYIMRAKRKPSKTD